MGYQLVAHQIQSTEHEIKIRHSVDPLVLDYYQSHAVEQGSVTSKHDTLRTKEHMEARDRNCTRYGEQQSIECFRSISGGIYSQVLFCKKITDQQLQEKPAPIKKLQTTLFAVNLYISGELKLVGASVDEAFILYRNSISKM